MSNKWHVIGHFLLVWLISSLLVAGYVMLTFIPPEISNELRSLTWVDRLSFFSSFVLATSDELDFNTFMLLKGLPNWLDGLLLSGWFWLASYWLQPITIRLGQHRLTRWVAIAITITILIAMGLWIWMPSPSFPNIDEKVLFSAWDALTVTIWIAGVTFFPPLIQTLALLLMLGLAVTILALFWRMGWQALLTVRPITNLRAKLDHLVSSTWTELSHRRAWQWFLRTLTWAIIILLVLDIVGVLLTANPAVVEWEPVLTTGFPSGGPLSVRALVVGPDGKKLFAGTENRGVFRSDDDGQTWQFMSQGLTNLSVRTLLVSPDGKSLFAGTVGGVFRSDDESQTWQPVNQGLLSELGGGISTLVVGTNGQELFAGITRDITSGFGFGTGADDWTPPIRLFRSNDGGESWQPAYQELDISSVESLVVKEDSQSLFIGTLGDGVFRSEDGGQTWQAINQGLTNLDVAVLVIESDNQTLLAGTSAGLFQSKDNGESWQQVGLEVTGFKAIAVTKPLTGDTDSQVIAEPKKLTEETDSQDIFIGTSENRQQVDLGITGLEVKTVTRETDSQDIFIGTSENGSFRSLDDGLTWQSVNQGLTNLSIHTLITVPSGKLFAGTGDGVFYFNSREQSWQSISQGLTDLDIEEVVLGPDQKSFFATTSGSGVFRYNNDNQAWDPMNYGLTDLDITTLTVGPNGKDLFVSTLGGGVFRFAPEDETWYPINYGLTDLDVMILTIGPNGKDFLAGTVGSGVFRFVTEEQIWVPIYQELAEQDMQELNEQDMDELARSLELLAMKESFADELDELEDLTLQEKAIFSFVLLLNSVSFYDSANSLQVSPAEKEMHLRLKTESESIFIINGKAIFRFDNKNQTWQSINKGLTNLRINSLLAGPSGTLFAGTDSGVFRSDNGGKRWQAVNNGLTDLDIQTLNIVPSGSLFAGTSEQEVFRSDNGGQTWQAVDTELSDLDLGHVLTGEESKKAWQVRNPREAMLEDFIKTFINGDEGDQLWSPIPVFSHSDLATSVALRKVDITRNEVSIDFTRPGMGWLRWATTSHHPPQTIAIHDNHAVLYSSAGAAMMMRAEVPLPIIWHAPTPYLAMVAATWRGIRWVNSNGSFLLTGLVPTVFLILSYVYFGVARPNQLRRNTILRLLLRPRHLLAASAYRYYKELWAKCSILEQIILLQAPTNEPFTRDQMESELHYLGAVFEVDDLRIGFSSLLQQELLAQVNGGWRVTEPLLTQVQRWELPRDELCRLAERTRHENPLNANVRRFLDRAGLTLTPVDTLLYRAEPQSAPLKRLLPAVVYARFLPSQKLDSDQVLAIRDQVKQVDSQASVVFAITDQRVDDDGWAQIGTLRIKSFTVLPIESALINKGLTEGRERKLLHIEIEDRLGAKYDPYDVRDPVAGAFSFFGRDALVETLLRRVADGRPVGIFGLRKLGKSSLLHALRDRAEFPVAVVNLQTVGRGSLDGLYRRVLRYWAQAVRVRYELDWPPPHITSDEPTEAFVAATLDLLDLLAEHVQQEVRLGIFLDEVELVIPQKDGSGPSLTRYLRLFRALRGLVDEDGRLSLVVASLNPAINRINAWHGEQNPTFSLFQEINLSPLTSDACIQMVRNIGAQIGLVYSPESLQAISSLSGGHPFLARQLCSLLYRERGHQSGRIEEREVRAIVQRFIYDDATAYHLDHGIWQEASNPTLWSADSVQVNQALLLELAGADGPVPRDDLLKHPDADARRSALFNMAHFHIIYEPQPGFYAIGFGLLRLWLRQRKLK